MHLLAVTHKRPHATQTAWLPRWFVHRSNRANMPSTASTHVSCPSHAYMCTYQVHDALRTGVVALQGPCAKFLGKRLTVLSPSSRSLRDLGPCTSLCVLLLHLLHKLHEVLFQVVKCCDALRFSNVDVGKLHNVLQSQLVTCHTANSEPTCAIIACGCMPTFRTN